MNLESLDAKRVQVLVAQQDIRDVYYRYCRGIDRRQYELVRSCYHPDAMDNHGDYVGGVDGFIDYIQANLPRFVRTMHFLGNILIEVDGTEARGEAYTLALHHLRASGSKPERDFVVALRYVDDFELRHGEWRIANRVCVFEWTRMDPLGDNPYVFAPASEMSRVDGTDPVFRSSLSER
jgi:hypothetical protein